MLTDGTSLAQMVQDLRAYQSELEIQNKALRYSQRVAEGASERFLALFSHVPLALMVVDEGGQVLESNAMALRLFRPREDDPPLNFLLPLVAPDHVERVAHAFGEAKTQGSCEVAEVMLTCASEGSIMGDLHIARIDSSGDDLPQFICAIVDQGLLLTQRHALEQGALELRQRAEELQASKDRLAAVINSSLDAILCVDREHRIIVFNPAAATLFQCMASEALGNSIERFLPQAEQALSLARVTTHAQLGEFEGRTAAGKTVAVEVSVSFEHHAVGDITTLFVRDLTARKKIEAHRNALEAQLRESQKMQAVGTMAGGIAHDFNNILSAILGNASLALEDLPADAAACLSLQEIQRAGRRARDLVQQILTFSRNEQPELSVVTLADVVREAVQLIKVALPPHVSLQVKLAPDTPPVRANVTQIEQALFNLCSNAMHAIGAQHGTITVELDHNLHQSTRMVERRAGARGQHVRLSVRDTGCGISAEHITRVFEPFFTTKPVGQGTGLGLAVVHGIMRSHSGRVEVESTLNVGSVFSLVFPVSAHTEVKPHAFQGQPTPTLQLGRNQHLLVVDDDQALTFLLQRALTRRGYRVTTLNDPQQALTLLREDATRFDLLVTDYNMPGFSGLDLLRETRRLYPSLPVALASGYITPDIERNALEHGARALVHKPNDLDELCATLQRLLDPPPDGSSQQ